MVERQKEWQNGRMAEMATYVLFMVHTDDDNNEDDDTLIFYITDKPIGASPGCNYGHTNKDGNTNNLVVLYMVRNDTSKKGGNAPRATN